MKVLERNLYSRNGHLYYRSAIPRPLQNLLSFKENVIALRLYDRGEARVIAAQINQAEQRILQDLQKQLSHALAEAALEGLIRAATESLESLKAILPHKPSGKFQAFPESKKRPQKAALLFSEISQKYLAECINDAPRTKQQKQATFELFVELQGDLVFQEIGVNEIQNFKVSLLKMPVNAKKILHISSFKDFDLNSVAKAETLKPKTINGRLAVLRALFGWAERVGYFQGRNPVSGLLMRGVKAATVKRPPFKNDEIKALFMSPVFRGCEGKEWGQRLISGNQVIKDAMYWVPLIGLYSGMRLNEICQLDLADLRYEEEVLVFDINESGEKRLKTASSSRIVPVHEKLIEAGIEAYAATVKQQGATKLFPDLKPGVNDSLSAPFSKRFRRLLDALEVTREGVCFHSLRHTFIDGLRNAGVERAICMVLTGHQSSDVHDQYGSGYNLRVLQEGINQLKFPVIEG